MRRHTRKSTSTVVASVMTWPIFCWEAMGPTIHMELNLLRITCLDIIVDQVRPFMLTDFYEGGDVFNETITYIIMRIITGT